MFGTIVLGVGSLFFIATGLNAFAAPAQFAARLGLSLPGADGVNEIRAQYGGFFLAAGLFVAGTLLSHLPRQGGLALMVVIFGGLIGGRLASLALDRSFAGYSPTIRALFVIDSCGFLASLIALTHAV
ncbi:MAG TPA: DUF4345 family protein [Rhizomicrobium sp.]|jgi:hypothetical protein|nr:DUF4345 family protein [Rhizomicrobium sp.]